ncbi:MAG: AAA family ATPase [Spongiibacteraceae bacterium]
MRILKLRFKNLNSLLGEWAIDLSHPAFVSDGIFAITGPTGAGKSTILDAICLALYGRTPRLNKITKSSNEIMSRQTGECFAEVTFETQSGRYRCHWSQHRSRKKASGDLQVPKHEIANADTGEVLEAKIKGVAEQIEVTTGMDFDRFTRSMLLAQGGFAAFLQAAPDERAPILEQITGSEIYSHISIRVHELRAQQRKQLDLLQAELAGMQFLTPDEEQQLSQSLQQKLEQEADLNKQLLSSNQSISWLERINQLEQDLHKIAQDKQALSQKLQDFVPEQTRLEAAVRALELSADYTSLSMARERQKNDQSLLKQYQQSLPSLSEAAAQAKLSIKTSTERLEETRLAQQKAQPLLKQVRELDVQIVTKQTPIEEASMAIAELILERDQLTTRYNDDSAELQRLRSDLSHLSEQQRASRADEALVESLAAIRTRFEAVKVLQQQDQLKATQISDASEQLRNSLQAWQQHTEALAEQQQRLSVIKSKQQELQDELQVVGEGREVADWRRHQTILGQQQTAMTGALAALQNMLNARRADAEFSHRRSRLNEEKTKQQAVLVDKVKQQTALEREVSLLEDQQLLLQRIEDLEATRHQLEDGKPCPLCGAEEHPYAQGNTPKPDQNRERLATAKSELKSVGVDISNLTISLASLAKDLEQIEQSKVECAEKILTADQQINSACAELTTELSWSIDSTDVDTFEHNLKQLQQQNIQALAHASKVLERVDAIEQVLKSLRNKLDSTSEALASAERESQSAEHNRHSAEQTVQRLKQEQAINLHQQRQALAALQQEVQVFGVEGLDVEKLDAVLQQLTARRDQWQRGQQQKLQLEQQINALEIQTNHQITELNKHHSELEKRHALLQAYQQDSDKLKQQRQELLGNKNPDDEDARLVAAVNTAEVALNEAREGAQQINQNLSQLQTRLSEVEQAINLSEPELKALEQAFKVQLAAADFVDEDHYSEAKLPEQERKLLALKSKQLADQQTEIMSMQREKLQLITNEKQKALTDLPLDALKQQQATLLINQKDLQQAVGALQHKLADNENLKLQQRSKVESMAAQQRECSRWDVLHELIGSSDGKKYRNFAQGLTFEIMVAHANRQLQKMSDRYLLIRDEAQPLELNVVDNYQAGEVRSTKNLSGGESFIVSLALALGLSNMASKNVRVDSLFLDEGFGTLDEEALDTALETLSGLQQEGKLIGVISHVALLKERISTQIEVTPLNGGRSQISGPGCGSV